MKLSWNLGKHSNYPKAENDMTMCSRIPDKSASSFLTLRNSGRIAATRLSLSTPRDKTFVHIRTYGLLAAILHDLEHSRHSKLLQKRFVPILGGPPR